MADTPGHFSGYDSRLKRAAEALRQAECVLIGGGAGLSDAAGLQYSGKRFTDHFAPFIARYGLEDMYTAGFYPFATQEEKWAYWARHISLNRYEDPATDLYRNLFRLVDGKDTFVLTSNVDGQFHKAGFPEGMVFAVQGDYGFFQCARGCHDTLYSNESAVARMIRQTADCAIPSDLVPVCPVCCGPMEVHIHKDRYFVRDTCWRDSEKRYADFLRRSAARRLALLELGVGFNTPGIIRYPFEELTYANPDAVLIRANRDHPHGAGEIENRTVVFTEDMAELVRDLLRLRA